MPGLSNLLAARWRMATSLALHIVLAVIGVGTPSSLEGFAFFAETLFL